MRTDNGSDEPAAQCQILTGLIISHQSQKKKSGRVLQFHPEAEHWAAFVSTHSLRSNKATLASALPRNGDIFMKDSDF